MRQCGGKKFTYRMLVEDSGNHLCKGSEVTNAENLTRRMVEEDWRRFWKHACDDNLLVSLRRQRSDSQVILDDSGCLGSIRESGGEYYSATVTITFVAVGPAAVGLHNVFDIFG